MTTTHALEIRPVGPASGVAACPAINIAQLRRLIERDGPSAHRSALARVADAADTTSVSPGSAAILRDPRAGEASQHRALSVIANQWDNITIILKQQATFDRDFGQLAAHWVAHEDLRKRGDVGALARSSIRLNDLRTQIRLSPGSLPSTP